MNLQKLYIIVAFCVAGLCSVTKAQNVISKSSQCKQIHDSILNRDYYVSADQKPLYLGGKERLHYFMGNHFSYKYEDGCDESIGCLSVLFIVETDGSLTFINANQSCFINYGNSLQIIHCKKLVDNIKKDLREMPKWRPAQCDNKAVPYLYNLPLWEAKK